MNQEQKSKYWKIGSCAFLFSLLSFFILGVISLLIPNRFFARMTPVAWWDYTFLILTSLLLGTYLSLWWYQKKQVNEKQVNKTCNLSATGGGVGGFLGFSCSLCNKLLILVLGAAGVMAYVEPIRPYVGLTGIGLLGFAVYKRVMFL